MSYAVGATLVCDTLQDAQDLCFTRNERVKVVTLKGHSINKVMLEQFVRVNVFGVNVFA